MQDPGVQEKLADQLMGVAPPLKPAEFRAFIQSDTDKVAELAKTINLGNQ